MCSSQTGCIKESRVIVSRLNEEDIERIVLQYQAKRKITEPDENKKSKRRKSLVVKQNKKKNINTTIPQNSLKSNEIHSQLNINRRCTRSKSSLFQNETKLKCRIRTKSNFTNSISVSSSQSHRSSLTSSYTTRQAITKSTRHRTDICQTKRRASKHSSIKKHKLQKYRKKHNAASKVQDNNEKNVKISENAQKPGNEFIIVLDDAEEPITNKKQLVQYDSSIETNIDNTKESKDDGDDDDDDDDDEDLTVIAETISVMEIVHSNSVFKVEKGSVTEKEQHNCSLLNSLMEENKFITINVPQHSETNNCFKHNFEPKEENKKVGTLRIKSPKSLGISDKKDFVNDYSTVLMKFDELLETNSTVDVIRKMYYKYYHTCFVNELLMNIISLLHLILIDIQKNPKLLKVLPNFKENIEEEYEQLESVLKKYSKKIVETYNTIINSFEENAKRHMIPVIYLQIIFAFKSSDVITQRGIFNLFFKLMQSENVNSEHDLCFQKFEHDKFNAVMKIFGRWLKPFLENDTKCFIKFEDLPSCSCLQKITLKCYFCNKPVSCEYFCQDQSFHVLQIYQSDEISKFLITCDEHKICSEFFNLVIGFDENLYADFTQNESSEVQILSKYEEEQPKYVFDEGISGRFLHCLNELCPMDRNVLCYYCKEPITCQKLCQIQSNQVMKIAGSDEFITIRVACESHQHLLERLEDMEQWQSRKYSSYVCFAADCRKKAIIACVCKMKSYCSYTCQEKHWYDEHHKYCQLQSDPGHIVKDC